MKALDFKVADRRLDILVDFQRGTSFPCPVCGQPSKVYDTEDKTWRHLDFFQHAAYLTARVPRCKCDEHGVKQVPVPWATARVRAPDRVWSNGFWFSRILRRRKIGDGYFNGFIHFFRCNKRDCFDCN